MTKACTKCGNTKSTTEFYKHAGGRDGLHPQCKECCKAKGVKYNADNKEKRSNKAKEKRLSDIESARKKDADKYAANPDRQKAASKRYAEKNPGINKRRAVVYRLNNPEKTKAATKSWRDSNNGACKVLRANRRARISNAGTLSKGLADKLFDLQRGKCACGCKQPLGNDYHMDHRMPLALGGSNTDDNMQLLRATCNLQKHAKHPIDFMQSRGYLL